MRFVEFHHIASVHLFRARLRVFGWQIVSERLVFLAVAREFNHYVYM